MIESFEGCCPPCRREIALTRRLDRPGAIRLIDVFAGGTAYPTDCVELLALVRALDDGRVVALGAAFAVMWRAFLRPRALHVTICNLVVLAGMHRFYVALLRLRLSQPRFVARFVPPAVT